MVGNTHTHTHTHTHIYIYIYIYIYCHPQTDCFVVSQFFNVARHLGYLKLGSKPTQIYIRLSIIPLSQHATNITSGMIRFYVVTFVCLHNDLADTKVLNLFEEFCITRVVAVNSFTGVLNPGLGDRTYIVIHRQTVPLYHNSSVWLDT